MCGNLKTAVIIGVAGQDGALLAAHLLESGWQVTGSVRDNKKSSLWRLDELGITDRIELFGIRLDDVTQIADELRRLRPTHIFHLAAESYMVSASRSPNATINVNTLGTLNVLQAMQIAVPDARFFNASSSEIFHPAIYGKLLNENSPVRPENAYAVSKAAAQSLVDIYRTQNGLHALSGILFNHESSLRACHFVTRKIAYNISRLKIEGGPPMELGSFNSARDWGAASEYVRLMPQILDAAPQQNYVIATGKATSIREFLVYAGQAAGFDPVFDGEAECEICVDKRHGSKLAIVSPKYYRSNDTSCRVGDATRLRGCIDFPVFQSVEEIAGAMVRSDIIRLERREAH